MVDTPIQVDLTLSDTAGSGTVNLQGRSVQLIVVGQTGYVLPSPSFWHAYAMSRERAALLIDYFGGKWLTFSSYETSFSSIARLGQRSAFIEALFDDLGPTLTIVPARQIDGVTCVGVKGRGRVLWIRMDNARAVKLVGPKKSGSLRFDRYDVGAPQAKPPADRIAEYS